MKRQGGALNTYYEVKEGNLKRLHAEWFQPQNNLEKAKLWKKRKLSKMISGFHGWVGQDTEDC